MVAQPHFLLFCDTHHSDQQQGDARHRALAGGGSGRWHFVLEQLDGPDRLEAADSELTVNRERLALLSVVRGLEALEQPSQVTLVTTSRYVSRGLRYGLSTWREADYMWERFGEQRPIRNSDLWRRVDTALQFHGVKCRLIQAGQTAAAAQAAEPWKLDQSPLVPLTPTAAADQTQAARERAGIALTPARANVLEGFPCRRVHVAASQSAARRLRYPPGRRTSASTKLPNFGFSANRWSLAAAWIRWWRGRMQSNPLFYGA